MKTENFFETFPTSIPDQTETFQNAINNFKALLSQLPDDVVNKDGLLNLTDELRASVLSTTKTNPAREIHSLAAKKIVLEQKAKDIAEKIEVIEESLGTRESLAGNFFQLIRDNPELPIRRFEEFNQHLCETIEEIMRDIAEYNREAEELLKIMSEEE